jgi:hypothetical protein
MPAPEKPRLRSTITGHLDPDNAQFVFLYDSVQLTSKIMRVRQELVPVFELFNGRNTLLDMQLALMRLNGGQLFPSQVLQDLIEKLNDSLFLEGPRLQEAFAGFLQSPIREPACIGSYEGEPGALRRQLDGLFTHERGPGAPLRNGAPSTTLRGALIPHIDFHRGGPTFAWGFKEIMEHSDADIFVILATAHCSGRRFILTRKDFRTPLGIATTDQDYVHRIADYYGDSVFEDELAHLREHSIEFQVVLLQHCLGDRPFRIVPLLVGSFQDCIANETLPHAQADIYLMIQALRRAEAESRARVCYIASGDLAHIGPKFGDPAPVDELLLEHSRRQDHELLQRAAQVDRAGFFDVLRQEQDLRRICGFPPTYTLLSVLEPERGKLLHYDQYVEPRGFESVSFASVGFYKSQTTLP